MREIGWFYLVDVSKGMSVDAIYDLTGEIELEAEVIFFTNIDSKNISSEFYATGLYLNEFYEDSNIIEKFLVEMCNEVENLKEGKVQEYIINIDNEEMVLKVFS